MTKGNGAYLARNVIFFSVISFETENKNLLHNTDFYYSMLLTFSVDFGDAMLLVPRAREINFHAIWLTCTVGSAFC